MKTKFNILSASLVGIVCASIMTPSFAVSSVRSLGGAGTVSGTSSVRSNVATGTSGSALTTARAGTLRVNNAGTGAALRTASTRSATAPRLSIGKYMAGSSALSGGSSKPVNPGQSSSTVDTEALKSDLQEWLGENVSVVVEDGWLIINMPGQPEERFELAGSTEDLEDKVNDFIDTFTADNEFIEIVEDENGKMVSAILASLNDDGTASTGLLTNENIGNFAIPKPGPGACDKPSSVCVLSLDNDGELYWLELVDEVSTESTDDESNLGDEPDFDL